MAAYHVWEERDGQVILAGARLSLAEAQTRYPWLPALAALLPSGHGGAVLAIRLVTHRRRLFIGLDETDGPGFPQHRGDNGHQHQVFNVFEWSADRGSSLRYQMAAPELGQQFPALAAVVADDHLVELLVRTPTWLLSILPAAPG